MIPDLQKLVGVFGGYNKITPEAWAQLDTDTAAYHKRRRIIDDAGVEPACDDPCRNYSSWEECATCYARGIFGYRKGTLAKIGQLTAAAAAEPGEFIWFCRSHMPAKHLADARRGT